MKETCESVRALEALLHVEERISLAVRISGCTILEDLHVRPDINIAAGHFGCAEEDVSAVATSTIHSDRVLPAVGGRAVQGDLTTLITVLRVGRPCGLIPSALEVVRGLAKCERHESKSEEGGLAEHVAGVSADVGELSDVSEA